MYMTIKDKIILSMTITCIILLSLVIFLATYQAKAADTDYKPKSDIHAGVHSTSAVVKQVLSNFDNPEGAIFSHDGKFVFISNSAEIGDRGAGFSWGVSEEIGKSVRLLEMFGLPGILYLKSYLEQISNHNFQKITVISAENISNNIPYCPISVGLNFMDQVHNLEKIDKINFSNLAYPLLIVPFLSRSSEIIGKKILLNLENFKFLFNYNQSIFSKFDNS